jgi:hypothetical protein
MALAWALIPRASPPDQAFGRGYEPNRSLCSGGVQNETGSRSGVVKGALQC